MQIIQPYCLELHYLSRAYRLWISFCPGVEYHSLVPLINCFLHPDEIVFFNALKYEKKRRSFLTSRYAAKQALEKICPGINPVDHQIKSGIFNQPLIPGLPVDLSLSHTGDLAAAAFFSEGMQIGIDLEQQSLFTEEKHLAIQTQFSNREKHHFAAGMDRRKALIIWTMKEALSKSLKCGLTTPFTILELESLQADPVNGDETVIYRSTYRNFPQYQGICIISGDYMFSVSLPVDLEIPARVILPPRFIIPLSGE